MNDKSIEENLKIFEEEVSQYISNDDDDDMELNQGTSNLPSDLNKILMNRNSIIDKQQERIKNFQNHVNSQNKTIQELENENNLIKQECLKIHETIQYKDQIINEFQTLAEVSRNKFKMFEETNVTLRDEIEKLNKLCLEYERENKRIRQRESLQENIIQNLQKNVTAYEKKILDIQSQLSLREEEYKEELGGLEQKLATKFKEREENLKSEYLKNISSISKETEILRIQQEKYKMEIKNLHTNIDNVKSSLEEKEHMNKIVLMNKDNDIAKLNRTIKELEDEKLELEEKLKNKQNFFSSKLKQSDEKEDKLLKEIYLRDKKIRELDEEVDSLRNRLMDAESEIKDCQTKLMTKDKLLEQIKNQNSEILRELNFKENEFSQKEENNRNDIEELVARCEKLSQEKNEYYDKIRQLQENLKEANIKLNETNEYCTDKIQSMELNYEKEKLSRDIMENKYKDAIRKLKDNEFFLQKEITELRQNISSYSKSKGLIDEDLGIKRKVEEMKLKTTYNSYEDPIENKQKASLENFKSILRNLDERIQVDSDAPVTDTK